MRAPLASAFLLTASLIAGVASAGMPPLPQQGTFKGSWAVSGTVEKSKAGTTVAHLEGKVTLESTTGLSREFDAVCNSVSDQKTGGVGRCVWTDSSGDTVTLEMSGSILGSEGTVRTAKGSVIGGTGRYKGIEGSIEMSWLFVESTVDDTRFKGYVTELSGSWDRD